VKPTNENIEETFYPQSSTPSITAKRRLEEKEKIPSATTKNKKQKKCLLLDLYPPK